MEKLVQGVNCKTNPQNKAADIVFCSDCENETEIRYSKEWCCLKCAQDDAPCDSKNCEFRLEEIGRCGDCNCLI